MTEKVNESPRGAGKMAESQSQKPAARLVKMVPAFPEDAHNFPSSADVHPDEVEKWSREGWKVSE